MSWHALQTQLLHREHLQQKMLEVSGRLSRTLLSISPNNILPPDNMLIPAHTLQKSGPVEMEPRLTVEAASTEELLA